MVDEAGTDYTIEKLQLRRGITATLVSLPANPNVPARGAMLYIHGFVDYFFQDHVARHFTEQGWNWYALDLRRNGRSLRPGQEPWYSRNILEYYEEIDQSIARIHKDGHTNIVLMGHSTGGLVASLWANDRRLTRPISALVLNSPWLDLQDDWFNREILTWVVRIVGRFRPLMDIPRESLESTYAKSIHRSAHGEWDFYPRWKPLTPQKVKMGFLGSVRAQQSRLHKGIDVGVPVLLLRSDKSLLNLTEWDDGALHADTVLNVEQMKRWLPKIGKDVTDVPLPGALHDVMLSEKSVRERAMSEIDDWLAEKL